MDKILPIAAMERIMKKASADLRVSEPAKEELRKLLEEYGIELSKKAATLALHAGRKTFKADDIILAGKE